LDEVDTASNPIGIHLIAMDAVMGKIILLEAEWPPCLYIVHSQNKEVLPTFRMIMYMSGQTVGALFFSVTLIH
jgi:hypothetical protein